MDKPGQALLGLFFASALLVSAAATAGQKPVLRAMAWLEPDGQLEALSTEPGAGFRVNSETSNQTDQIMAGMVVFNTPTLLGGQAAKAGISCASCHVNGRDNPHFQFPGVSGAPGTADVTHSFFSSRRGDGQFNPVAIPDLAQAGKISRQSKGELEAFIRGLIVEEFDGAEPAAATLDALASYVRALCSDCRLKPRPITFESHLRMVEQAVRAAEKNEARKPDLTYVLLSGARHQLRLVHERFHGKRLSKERAALINISSDIGKLQQSIGVRSNRYYRLSRAIPDKLRRLRTLLTKSQEQSLYDKDRLTAVLQPKSKKR